MREWKIQMKPDGRVFTYLHDKDAETMRCDPIPTKEELEYWYSTNFDYGWFDKRALLKRLQAWHRWFVFGRQIKRYLKEDGLDNRPKILDIGCGHGWFLDSAKKSGFETYGIDFPSIAIENAEKKGHHVLKGDFLDLDLDQNSFDVITMWHSLEHVVDPNSVLEKVKLHLKPNGLFLVAVPNLSARGVAIHDVAWAWIQQPFVHIWHWTPFSLNYLLTSNGFKAIQTTTRDTWDASTIYDGYLQYDFEIVVKKIARKFDSILANVFRIEKRPMENILGFYFVEFVRLLSYSVNRAIFFIDNKKGSELIVISKN